MTSYLRHNQLFRFFIAAIPMISDSSDDEGESIVVLNDTNGSANFDSVSRPVSPSISSVHDARPTSRQGMEVEDDSVTCLWDDCGVVFTNLQVFIDHIHNECDKSFTRSDALAKHMRLQHNIEPPAPGRGGARKRKRGEGQGNDGGSPPPTNGTGVFNSSGGAFRTFKVEQPWSTTEPLDEADVDYDNYVRTQAQHAPDSNPDDGKGDGGYVDALPPQLRVHYDPQTKTVLGRSPEMVLYILMKAKYKYATDQQDMLIHELKSANAELVRVREEKDAMMDRVLRATFGPEAEVLTMPIPKPPGMVLDQEALMAQTNGAGPTIS
ncbi:hypothetical protein D9757_006180 [Collybiopsis confluens]|uniref:C2H2-type domain-containing protein n=1 Tax=Collybiopsis confluens TaxID=2823264 RepID=A0A8H5HHN7_9AGAR|nr:hypothetical protein D9757_006180 [Collybiopsis confluens]